MTAPIRILLIEDEPADVELLRQAIAANLETPMALAVADRLAAGLARLAADPVDVLVLDLRLPDSQGLATLEQVRAEAPQVPIVVLTASDDEEAALRALQRGAQDYLVKGYVHVFPKLLGHTLRYAIERHQVEFERVQLQQRLNQAQKMETVGRFAGGIAHDFNNYLQVILGFAWLIRTRRAHDQELLGDLHEIVHAAESASGIVGQLLTFSRRQPLQPKQVDINQAVRGMERLLAQFVGERIRVELRLAEEPLIVTIDPTGLEQILMNLSANARDSMPQHGRLTISASPVTLDAAFRRRHPWCTKDGESVRLSVQDTGTGMAPEVVTHLFEPFFTTKHTGRGTGLGLAVVYSLVQQHDGLIDVETTLGCGTTFHLYFPRAAVSAPEPLALTTPPAPASAWEAGDGASAGQPRRRVLIVDDEPPILSLCQRILEPGYEVTTVTSGRAALERLRQASYDLLLTDLIMPEMDGFELLGEVGKLRHRLAGVLAMTGSITIEAEQRLHALPQPAPLLRKPFTAPALLAAVSQCLSSRG